MGKEPTTPDYGCGLFIAQGFYIPNGFGIIHQIFHQIVIISFIVRNRLGTYLCDIFRLDGLLDRNFLKSIRYAYVESSRPLHTWGRTSCFQRSGLTVRLRLNRGSGFSAASCKRQCQYGTDNQTLDCYVSLHFVLPPFYFIPPCYALCLLSLSAFKRRYVDLLFSF